MSTPPTTIIGLLPGSDVRVLGVPVRERNRRVAERHGATIVDADALESYGDRPAVLVPPRVLIDGELFALVARAASPVRLPGPVVVGRARDLGGIAADLSAARALPAGPDHPAAADVSSAAARRAAAWTILRRTAKATDGWVSRHCNRPLSRLVSYVLLSLRLRASHASFLTLLFGLAAAVVAAQPGYGFLLLTGVLFHLASVLDGVDGEMARATLTESAAGARIDTLVDQATYLACFAGVMIGWAREAGGTRPIVWAAFTAAALVLSLLRAGRFVARHAPTASFVFVDRTVRRAARMSTRRGLRLAGPLFLLLRRDVFAVMFCAAALTGVRAVFPALVLAGVVIANATFSLYGRELTEAALAEKIDDAARAG